MKKPALYYSEASLRDLVKRLKGAETLPGSTGRRMVETMRYDRWRLEQEARDNDILREFVTDVFEIIYGVGQAPDDWTQALDDLRAINEAACSGSFTAEQRAEAMGKLANLIRPEHVTAPNKRVWM